MKKTFLFILFGIAFSVKCFSQLNCIELSYINNALICGGITDTVCGCNGISYPNYCEAFYHHGVTNWTSGSCTNPPACHADFNYSGTAGNYNFTNTSSLGTTIWFWDFGDGSGYSNSQSPSYSFTSSGTYIVCLTITDGSGCESTTCKVIEAVVPNQNCSALFGYSDSCGVVHFIDFSTGNNLSYAWDFGDGTFGTGLNPYHTYSTSGWFNVCLIITDTVNACTNQFCQSCFIHIATGVASFTYSNQSVFLISFNGSFSGTASNWYWNFGDGNSANIQDTAYTYTGCIYNACLQVADDFGCLVAPVCQTINACIANPCYVNFSHVDSCNSVKFSSQNLTNNTIYNWSFDDGTFSSAANPIHNYSASGNYNVCLISTDTVLFCSDTACHAVTVHVMNGSPTFIYSNITFNPNVVNLVGSFSDTATNWLWNFGDGQSTSTINSTVQHTYSNCIYTVCLQVHDSFDCYSPVVCDTVVACELSNSCTADFNFLDSCGSVQFTNLSIGLNSLVYYWDFGDFNSDSLINPIHQYLVSNSYEICLTINDSINQCLKTYCDSVSVHVPNLIVNFSHFQTSHIPNIVSFFDFTPGIGIQNWEWNFNDTTSIVSGVQNPVHTFNGCEYLVCLTVSDSFGCSSMFCDSLHLCADNISEVGIKNFTTAFYNPNTNTIDVLFSSNTNYDCIDLFDLLGRKQYENCDLKYSGEKIFLKIPAKQLQSTIYFLVVRNKQEMRAHKIEVIK